MNRSFAIALCAMLAGCASGGPAVPQVCQTDAECDASTICFPLQGCGDPGGGLVVEVQGNTRTGQLAQDFEIGDAGLKPVKDFLLVPAILGGEFVREGANYANSVTVRVRGESELIPGVVRSYQSTFTKPERGAYALPVGAGKFSVTAETADTAIPPSLAMVSVKLGSNQTVSFDFAPADKTIVVAGRLLKRIDPGATPDVPVSQPMDVQAFDPNGLKPLSQKVPVSSTGDFVLFVAPSAEQLSSFLVTATPHEPGALVPSKTFSMKLPLEPTIRLLLGEYGDPVPQMKGTLKTTGGTPVSGATVFLEGPVNGGGVFRSKVVTTDVGGVFGVDLLPSAAGAAYVLTALPPPNSVAGVVQKSVQANAGASELKVVSTSNAKDTNIVICPDKITVVGTLVRPENAGAAAGAVVVARAIERLKELANQPLAMGESQGLTDESGRFKLELDPGVYQIDFIPGGFLPRHSRVVTVRAETITGADGGTSVAKSVDMKETELRKGRNVTGVVTAPNAVTGVVGPAVSATVRYFRVSPIGGTTSSLLLDEAITDSRGNYSVFLPTK